MHVGQAIVAPGMAVRELRVIESEQMQNGGVEVVDVDSVRGDGRSDIVCFAVAQPPFDAASREPT